MDFRRLAFGLMAIVALVALAACQESTTQPSVQATAIPTAMPAATATPEEPPTNDGVLASNGIPQGTPTPLPATEAATSGRSPLATPEQPGGQNAPDTQSASQSIDTQPQPQDAVFYQQNGLTLEYHWPLDGLRNLSADEMQIIAYNESGGPIEFVLPKITFTENGEPRPQQSGTWEKFPSRYSWDRSEYISISPSAYQGETLVLLPGEKAKLHWHMDSVASKDTKQVMALELKVTTGATTQIIAQTLERGSEQGTTSSAATPEPTQETTETQEGTSSAGHVEASGSTSDVRWSFNGTTWSPSGAPPDCADPFTVQTPVDLDLVTAALWPGQQRGAYVAHGGFRFDGSRNDDVTVRAPIGSHLVQAGRYLEGVDEQFLLFFSVPCGFFYRLDHVRSVPAKLAEAFEHILPPVSNDSRTYYLNPPLWIEQGEVVGTSVGIAPSNVFVDFGLYDVRTPNNVVPNAAWAELFAGDKEFGHYGVCFFDYLPGTDGETMRSLPTGKEGQTSDYCE